MRVLDAADPDSQAGVPVTPPVDTPDPAVPGDAHGPITYDGLIQAYPPLPRYEIRCGRGGRGHLSEWFDTAKSPFLPSGALASLTGIPIVVDEGLADNQMQIRDSDGNVIKEVWF